MRTRFSALLAAFLLVAGPAWGQTVTVKTAVSISTWSDLGAGPMQISATAPIIYAISDTSPSLTTGTEGFKLAANETRAVITPSHVWASAQVGAGATVFSAPVGGGQAVVYQSCGTANYSNAIGQLRELTMNTAGYLCASTTTLLAAREEEQRQRPTPLPQEQEERRHREERWRWQ